MNIKINADKYIDKCTDKLLDRLANNMKIT